MTLRLVLKRKWYDLIDKGVKTEEYREITLYWKRRIWGRRHNYVTFYLGYAKDRPSMTFEIESIKAGAGKEEWGAVPGCRYFVIKLGRRI